MTQRYAVQRVSSGEPVAERCCGPAGVQQHAADESVAELVAEGGEVAGIVPVHRCGCVHLDAHNATVSGFEDEVNFLSLVHSVMVDFQVGGGGLSTT